MNCTGTGIGGECEKDAKGPGNILGHRCRISKEDQKVREAEEEGRGRELKWEDEADCSIAVVSRLILYSSLLHVFRLLVE